MSMYRLRLKIAPYLFISPFFILFACFMLYPFMFSIYTSFTEWSGIAPPQFNHLDNYAKLFRDSIFKQSIINGLVIYVMYVPIMVLLALLLAVGLTRPWVKLKSLFRAALFIPNITSVVAVAFLFQYVFSSSETGIINSMIRSMGFDVQISWFGSALNARIVVSILILWRWLGYNMILMMAGLSNIDDELFEAAEIDGAGAISKFVKITIPLMRHSILFSCVMSTMGTFSMFVEPRILTRGGGPMNSTISTVLYMYNTAFEYMKMGYASAIAVAYFIIIMVITLLQFQVNKQSN